MTNDKKAKTLSRAEDHDKVIIFGRFLGVRDSFCIKIIGSIMNGKMLIFFS